MTPFKYNMTLKEYNRRRAILKALLQVYVDHRTIVEGGLSLVDVSTSLSWSRAQTEALVETLVSEGYLYSTHNTVTDHYHRQFWPFGGRRTFETLATKAPPVACARFTKLPALIVRTLSIPSLSGRHDAQALLRSVGGGS